MKPKTHKRTIWAARFPLSSYTDSGRTYLYEEEPSAERYPWGGKHVDVDVSNFLSHDPRKTHYGLRPGQKKKLVVELTIRET